MGPSGGHSDEDREARGFPNEPGPGWVRGAGSQAAWHPLPEEQEPAALPSPLLCPKQLPRDCEELGRGARGLPGLPVLVDLARGYLEGSRAPAAHTVAGPPADAPEGHAPHPLLSQNLRAHPCPLMSPVQWLREVLLSCYQWGHRSPETRPGGQQTQGTPWHSPLPPPALGLVRCDFSRGIVFLGRAQPSRSS